MSGEGVELGASGPRPAPSAQRTLELRRGEAAPKDLAKLKEFAVGFESLLTSTLLGELLKPLENGGGFAGSGPGASVVQGLIESNLADHLSKSGGLGVGRVIVESMKPMLASQQVSLAELTSKLQQAAQRAPEKPEKPEMEEGR